MDDVKPTTNSVDHDFRANSMNTFVSLMGSYRTAPLSHLNAMQWNNRYVALTLNRSLVSEMYQEHGVIQVIIDQPVDDAFRGGIVLQIPELETDDVKKLDQYVSENNILITYASACKYARLYGGSGVIINAGQKMDAPFNINSIKDFTPLAFYAADRWELSYTTDGMGVDQFQQNKIECPYNYYGKTLHKTNVIKINGKEAPSLLRGQFGGWGVSEMERIVRPYNQYMKQQNVVYEILDEAKIDVYKINGFNSAMSTPNGPAQTAKRIQIANSLKNFENAVVLDMEDEYEQKSYSFGGLPEVLKDIRIGLACETRFPMAKLFGLSAAGFNSGEDDIENYNAMIETEIRSKIKGGLVDMLKVCCQKLFGFVPQSIDFDWKPLRVMTNKEESDIKTQELDRILAVKTAGIASDETIADMINASKIFTVDIDPAEAVDVDPDLGGSEEDPEDTMPTPNSRSK